MALQKNAPVVESENNRAVAFVNWALPMADGSMLKASKGFTIFQNPKYPNKHEDVLVELARKHGGIVEIDLKCRIMINKSTDISAIDLDSIIIHKAEPVTPAA